MWSAYADLAQQSSLINKEVRLKNEVFFDLPQKSRIVACNLLHEIVNAQKG